MVPSNALSTWKGRDISWTTITTKNDTLLIQRLISLKCDLYSLRNRRKITAKELGTKGVSDELFVLKSKNKIKQKPNKPRRFWQLFSIVSKDDQENHHFGG